MTDNPGRVHMAQIQIEKDFLTSSFSILEDQPMDMLLGKMGKNCSSRAPPPDKPVWWQVISQRDDKFWGGWG